MAIVSQKMLKYSQSHMNKSCLQQAPYHRYLDLAPSHLSLVCLISASSFRASAAAVAAAAAQPKPFVASIDVDASKSGLGESSRSFSFAEMATKGSNVHSFAAVDVGDVTTAKNVFTFGRSHAAASHSLRVDADGDLKVEDVEAGDDNDADESDGNKPKKHRLSIENERYR